MQQPASASAEVKKGPSRKRLVITAAVGVIVMVGVFTLLFPQISSYEQALQQLERMSYWWIGALALAGLLNILAYPLTVLVAVPGLSYRRGFIERQAGFLISNIIPGGGAFAVGTQYAILSRYRVPAAVSAAAVSADAVWTYLITLGMPALAVMLLVLEGRSTAGMTTIAVIGILVVVVSVVLITVILRSEAGARWVGNLGQRVIAPVLRRIHRPTPDLVSALVNFREQAHDLVARKWKELTLTNLLAQATPLFVLFFALCGLDAFPHPLSIFEIFGAYSVALLLVSIPITPGGLGTVDAALIGLLIAFGADGSVAVAADLLWRLVWFLPQLLTGVVCMLIYIITRHRPLKDPVVAG